MTSFPLPHSINESIVLSVLLSLSSFTLSLSLPISAGVWVCVLLLSSLLPLSVSLYILLRLAFYTSLSCAVSISRRSVFVTHLSDTVCSLSLRDCSFLSFQIFLSSVLCTAQYLRICVRFHMSFRILGAFFFSIASLDQRVNHALCNPVSHSSFILSLSLPFSV